MDWLREFLSPGPARHGATRRAAEEAGITTGTFYNAVRLLGLAETLVDGCKYLQFGAFEGAEDTPCGGAVVCPPF
jgi:hypothetical protein